MLNSHEPENSEVSQQEPQQLLLPIVSQPIAETFTNYTSEFYPVFRPYDFVTNNRSNVVQTMPVPKTNKGPSLNAPRQLLDARFSNLFEATYANVEVYELTIGDVAVMRRKSDDFINATHMMKAAGYDKGPRTKILEKEVQHEVHDKIQGKIYNVTR
jgi:hypothetical protein